MAGYVRHLLKLAATRKTFNTALPVCLVVGTALNLINQAQEIFAWHGINWFHLALNYVVPYCVASYSAAKNEASRDSPS